MKSPLPSLGVGVLPVARGRGDALATQGRVRWTHRAAQRVEASVEGHEAVEVTITRTDRTLVAWCTCADANPSPMPCEHAWACLVDAWREGMNILRGSPPTTLLWRGQATPNLHQVVESPPPPAARVTANDAPTFAQLGFGRLLHAPRRDAAPPRAAPTRAAFSAPALRGPPRPAARDLPRLHYLFTPVDSGTDALEVQILISPPPRRGTIPRGTFQIQLHASRLYDGSPDGDALDAILGRPTPEANGRYGRFTGVILRGAARTRALAAALATGRGFVREREATPDGAVPLVRDDGPPWKLALRAREAPDGAWRIEGVLRRGDASVALADARAVFSDGAIVDDRLARFDDDGGASWVDLLRLHGAYTCTERLRGAFLDELFARVRHPELELPEGRAIEIVDGTPEPRLVIEPGDRLALSAKLSFRYEGAVVPAGRLGATAYDAKLQRLVRRDPEAEARARQAALDAGLRAAPRAAADDLEIAPDRFTAAAEALLAAGFRVEAAGAVYRRSGSVHLRTSSGVDWFEVRGDVEFEGASVDLSAVLEAARRGDTYVVLGDGTLGLLPDEWLRRHGFLTRLGERRGEAIRFRRAQVGMLDSLLAAHAADADPLLRRARDELRSFEGIRPEDPGPRFTGTLRGYQREGLGWLRFLERFGFGGCLADEMGLGKTIQVLAHLASRERKGPSLVVAPKSLVYNWRNETARFAPSLRVLEHAGAARLSTRRRFEDHDLVLTTYGTLRRDAAALADVAFDYVILDEGQAIKNDASDTAKAARVLRAEHRLVLSGTPVENHLGELWSIFEFMNPGMLGGLAAFREVIATDAAEAAATPLPRVAISATPLPRVAIARAVRPFLLRRTKAAVAPELPPRVDETLLCELGEEQRAVYEELRQRYRAALLGRVAEEGIGRAKIHVLEALLRLRQAACHPALADARYADRGSAKLTALAAALTGVVEGGHKALVFSQFTRLLALVREQLDHDCVPYAYLDGQTTDREAQVSRFQTDPDCPVFLVSLKAGGTGLNLTAAEYVFLLDPWWNPAVEAQAMDRAHRIGQTRTVFTYRLVARDTIEERILGLQRDKRLLAESLFEESSSLLADLTAEDLDALLS
ncbi:MAG TPA: DEAD/DEAH box helicase [Byssovorax sp.]